VRKPADGVYGAEALFRFGEGVEADPNFRTSPDRNVFEWYELVLSQEPKGLHIIDWGAGLGRFLPIFESIKPAQVTLVEPSTEAIPALRELEQSHSNLNVVAGGLGASVPRIKDPSNTLHFANFVINCLPTPKQAFSRLADSLRPGERVWIFTNVFVPSRTYSLLDFSNPFASIKAQDGTLDFGLNTGGKIEIPPVAKTFENRILKSGDCLVDVVHTIDEVRAAIEGADLPQAWTVRRAAIMPPCGFEHVIRPDEDFGTYGFVVLVLLLERGSNR
jgi:hypothetical protein